MESPFIRMKKNSTGELELESPFIRVEKNSTGEPELESPFIRVEKNSAGEPKLESSLIRMEKNADSESSKAKYASTIDSESRGDISSVNNITTPKKNAEGKLSLQVVAPPNIYQPDPISYDRYKATSKLIVPEIVAAMKANTTICSYEGQLYVLSKQPPERFKALSGYSAQQYIKYFCRTKLNYSCDVQTIDAVKKTLLYDDEIVVSKKNQLPLNVWPFADGLIDIEGGVRIKNDLRWFYTMCFNCNYQPDAYCPTFDTLISSICGGNEQIRELLWQVIGYILSNDTKAKCFFTFAGPKDTGKSLMANIISEIFQEDAVVSCNINDFGGKYVNGGFIDKRLVCCMDLTDTPVNARAVGMIKTITGGDRVTAEMKYKNAKTVRLNCVLLFGTNHSIRTEQPDTAFTEREVLVPFLYPVPKEKQDKFLLEKIRAEQSGIVNKAASAYIRLVENNYIFSPVENPALKEIEIDGSKVISDFCQDYCDFTDTMAKTSTYDLYKAYENFCRNRGLPTMEKNEFSTKFNILTPSTQKKKINSSQQGYIGVRLKTT